MCVCAAAQPRPRPPAHTSGAHVREEVAGLRAGAGRAGAPAQPVDPAGGGDPGGAPGELRAARHGRRGPAGAWETRDGAGSGAASAQSEDDVRGPEVLPGEAGYHTGEPGQASSVLGAPGPHAKRGPRPAHTSAHNRVLSCLCPFFVLSCCESSYCCYSSPVYPEYVYYA